jgi:hypothetical protein
MAQWLQWTVPATARHGIVGQRMRVLCRSKRRQSTGVCPRCDAGSLFGSGCPGDVAQMPRRGIPVVKKYAACGALLEGLCTREGLGGGLDEDDASGVG